MSAAMRSAIQETPEPEPAASLLAAAGRSDLSAAVCDLDYWFRAAGRPFGALRRGRDPRAVMPALMLERGPLREAIYDEFAFRARTEEAAVRSISAMIQCAPCSDTRDFYATQLLDEARHAYVFRWHLIELGTPRARIEQELERIVGARRHTILAPLEDFARESAQQGDFYGLVILLTVIAEGALAPAAELSERKWRRFDPPAAQICAGANRDEIRHLAVGSALIREHLIAQPHERERLEALLQRGMELWAALPLQDSLLAREQAFQRGIERHGELLGDQELVPGRLLAETRVEERLELQRHWSEQMRRERLQEMGLAPR